MNSYRLKLTHNKVLITPKSHSETSLMPKKKRALFITGPSRNNLSSNSGTPRCQAPLKAPLMRGMHLLPGVVGFNALIAPGLRLEQIFRAFDVESVDQNLVNVINQNNFQLFQHFFRDIF